MAGAAVWLGLVDEPRLGQSTWDGKRWWNRPEIGRDSRLGAAPAERNVDRRLGGLDQARIRLLLGKAPHIQALYPEAVSAQRFPWWVRLAALVTPWRQEGQARWSDFRSLEALLSLSPIWPRRFKDALKAAWRRERYRTRLLAMNAGTKSIRERLPDWRKPAAIRSVLILTPTNNQRWRSRALTAGAAANLKWEDRLGVAFLDEASGDRTLSSTIFWLVVLTAGRGLAGLQTYGRLRWLVIALALRHRGDVAELPLLSHGDRLVNKALAVEELEMADV
jgi:hypothetical protein